MASFLDARDAAVRKSWTADQIFKHWWPEVENLYDDDLFECSVSQGSISQASQLEIIDRMRRRVGRMHGWVATRGSDIYGRSNIVGRPAEIVGREDKGWEDFELAQRGANGAFLLWLTRPCLPLTGWHPDDESTVVIIYARQVLLSVSTLRYAKTQMFLIGAERQYEQCELRLLICSAEFRCQYSTLLVHRCCLLCSMERSHTERFDDTTERTFRCLSSAAYAAKSMSWGLELLRLM